MTEDETPVSKAPPSGSPTDAPSASDPAPRRRTALAYHLLALAAAAGALAASRVAAEFAALQADPAHAGEFSKEKLRFISMTILANLAVALVLAAGALFETLRTALPRRPGGAPRAGAPVLAAWAALLGFLGGHLFLHPWIPRLLGRLSALLRGETG